MLSLAGHTRVQDVAWAPSVGRPYHLIASCGSEGAVAVWKVWTAREEAPPEPAVAATAAAAAADDDSVSDGPRPWGVRRLVAAGTAAASLAVAFADQAATGPVWRVEWNVLGTVLAAAGDDGVLRLRRQAAGGSWELASELPLTGPEDVAAVHHSS